MREVEFRVRGLVFSGRAAGPTSGPLVLLLHGLPRTSWEWHHQIDALGDRGFHAVAPDLRGSCPGAGPDDVAAHHLDEFCADAIAIADRLAGRDQPFHLVGTSSGAFVAWRLASRHPARVRTVTGLNIPHQGAILDVLARDDAVGDDQRSRFGYFEFARAPGNERMIFDEALRRMELPDDEIDPYRTAFSTDESLRILFHFYRAMPDWFDEPLEAVGAPALFVWPRHWGNVSEAAVDAMPAWATGPLRVEAVDGRQPVAQSDHAAVTRLLLEHLSAAPGDRPT